MMRDDAPPKVRRSMMLLTVAVALTWAAQMWLGWRSYCYYRDRSTTAAQDLRLEELRGSIVHLDEVLTMSARMAAATGDVRWEQRYRRFEPQLGVAIEQALRLAPEAFRGEAAAETDKANIELVAIERRVFALVRQGNLVSAQALLLSDEYEAQKQVYAQGMVAFAGGLADAAVASLQRQQRQALRQVALGFLLVPFLVTGWLGVLRATRHWQASLTRLNRSLDQKVVERTSELGRVNERLRAEITERKQATEQLEESLAELDRFNRLAVGREQRMIELKRQINDMARQADMSLPYDLSFADGPDHPSTAPAPPSVAPGPD